MGKHDEKRAEQIAYTRRQIEGLVRDACRSLPADTGLTPEQEERLSIRMWNRSASVLTVFDNLIDKLK